MSHFYSLGLVNHGGGGTERFHGPAVETVYWNEYIPPGQSTSSSLKVFEFMTGTSNFFFTKAFGGTWSFEFCF